MPLPFLPTEILVAIAEFVEELWDLRRLRFVSRAWAGAAHPYLFRRIEFGPYDSTNKAAGEVILELTEGQDHQLPITKTLLSTCINLSTLHVVAESEPRLALAALEPTTSLKLRELYFWEALRTPGELEGFASYLNTCPSLRCLGFEGLQTDDPDELGDYETGIALLKQAAKRHRLEDFSIGVLHPPKLFNAFISHSHTSLRRLHVEISDFRGDDPLDLGQLDSLEGLHFWRSSWDYHNGESLEGDSVTILQRCNAPPSLRQLSVDFQVDEESDYPTCYDTQVWRYISDDRLLSAVPPSFTDVSITGGLFEADEALGFLQSTTRPTALQLLELDVYTTPSSPSTVADVAKCCHVLGVHYKLSPYEAILSLTTDEWERRVHGRYCCGEESLARAGEVVKWDGGEWEEPNSGEVDD